MREHSISRRHDGERQQDHGQLQRRLDREAHAVAHLARANLGSGVNGVLDHGAAATAKEERGGLEAEVEGQEWEKPRCPPPQKKSQIRV